MDITLVPNPFSHTDTGKCVSCLRNVPCQNSGPGKNLTLELLLQTVPSNMYEYMELNMNCFKYCNIVKA